MSNIDLNLETICKLRKRQQLFAMPSFRATVVSPYPAYTQQQLDMRRKVEILQYPNNKLSTRTNNLTKKELYAQIISGKIQPKSYTTTYIETIRYEYDKVLDKDFVFIDRTPVYSNPECPLDDLIQTPTSSSDVPGPIINLYKDNNIPLYNYANSINNDIYAITDNIDNDLWKLNFMPENTFALRSIQTTESGTYETNAADTTLASVYITNHILDSRYTFEFQIPVGFYFYGIYKEGTNPVELTNIHLTIPFNGFNPQVLFAENPVKTNRTVTFHTDSANVSDISFDVPNAGQDFSGSLYAGMLKITNIDLFTEPGYVYDLNIITDITLQQDVLNTLSANYDFYYGLSYNRTDINKKVETGCTINTSYSSNPFLPIKFTNTL
jgi:hypothetical protein